MILFFLSSPILSSSIPATFPSCLLFTSFAGLANLVAHRSYSTFPLFPALPRGGGVMSSVLLTGSLPAVPTSFGPPPVSIFLAAATPLLLPASGHSLDRPRLVSRGPAICSIQRFSSREFPSVSHSPRTTFNLLCHPTLPFSIPRHILMSQYTLYPTSHL